MSQIFRIAILAKLLALAHICWALPQVNASPNAMAVANICESAAQIASQESGVPLDVLRSISLTETGRNSNGMLHPWPWTVNMEGLGKWFKTVGEAQHYVDLHFSDGARSFDVGCFQINYRWHGEYFASIEDMFDPTTNARYAARFLNELYLEMGSWSRAAGAYHSRSPKFATKYRARFDRIRANLSPPPLTAITQTYAPQVVTETHRPRQNNFPLLQSSGQHTSAASLVHLEDGGTRLIDHQAERSLTDQ